MNDTLPPYTYGTMSLRHDEVPFETRVAVARAAMERCTWFHTSHKYGPVLKVLHQAFREAPGSVPRLSFKLSGDTWAEVAQQIQMQVAAVGVDHMDLGQLHMGGALAQDFVTGGAVHDELRRTREQGQVRHWSLEVHPWTSWIARDHLSRLQGPDVMDSYTFYYNPLQRYALNDAFARIRVLRRPIVALRSLGGGNLEEQAARPARQEDFLGARAREVLPLYRASGSTRWEAYCADYIRSQAGVLTSVGGAGSLAHLEALVGAFGRSRPFDASQSQALAGLQERWSEELDRHAPEWSM